MKRTSDIILALFVMAITAMLVIPLPTFLLDILLVLNLSVAVLLLLVGLYMPHALALLAFPSLLLLTTLFRLGLNVASTRLILSQGDAGQVIQSFGTFLVRGEVVVGIIIFSIITIVNFIVIARGSARVSEVAARFTLEAVPGKQMSIDSEMRAGTITVEEARIQREELRKESQLYGSMDGAMKFVQGDAVAGFFIILTNIVGGIYLGISRGQSLADAVGTYTILTVGDGLVTQIPALLISICAGIVVTRVSAGENTTLGSDLGTQLFSNPQTVAFSGIILCMIGLLPGLPKIPFFAVGAVFLFSSYMIRKSARIKHGQPALKLDYQSGTLALLSTGKAEEELHDEQPVIIALDAVVAHKLYKNQAARYIQWWQDYRASLYEQMGLRLPDLKIVSDEFISPSTYSVSYSGSLIEREPVLLDTVLVETSPESASVFGLEVMREAIHPITHSRVVWAAHSITLKKVVEAAQIRSYDFFEFIGLRIASFFLNHPSEVITLSEVHSALKQLEKRYPGLVGDVLQRNFIDIPRLTQLLQELIRQGISIRDFKQIVECVASYCSNQGITASDADSVVLSDLVTYIRQVKKRQLISKQLSSRGTLRVFTISQDAEQAIEDIPEGSEISQVALEPQTHDALHFALQNLVRPVLNKGILPVSLLVRSDLRARVQGLLRLWNEPLKVVTFDELEPSLEVEHIGRLAMEGNTGLK